MEEIAWLLWKETKPKAKTVFSYIPFSCKNRNKNSAWKRLRTLGKGSLIAYVLLNLGLRLELCCPWSQRLKLTVAKNGQGWKNIKPDHKWSKGLLFSARINREEKKKIPCRCLYLPVPGDCRASIHQSSNTLFFKVAYIEKKIYLHKRGKLKTTGRSSIYTESTCQL